MYTEHRPIRKKMEQLGIMVKDVAEEVPSMPYPTVYSQLSGISPLSETVKRAAEKLIEKGGKK